MLLEPATEIDELPLDENPPEDGEDADAERKEPE